MRSSVEERLQFVTEPPFDIVVTGPQCVAGRRRVVLGLLVGGLASVGLQLDGSVKVEQDSSGGIRVQDV